MPNITKKQIPEVKEMLRIAKMENAGFGFPEDIVTFHGRETHIDEFIKEQTRLYRETWLIAPLERLLNELEAKSKKK